MVRGQRSSCATNQSTEVNMRYILLTVFQVWGLAFVAFMMAGTAVAASEVPIATGRNYSLQDVEVIRRAETVIFDACPGLAELPSNEEVILSLTRLGEGTWGDNTLKSKGWVAYVSLSFWIGTQAQYVALGEGDAIVIEAKGAAAQSACGLPVSQKAERYEPLDLGFQLAK